MGLRTLSIKQDPKSLWVVHLNRIIESGKGKKWSLTLNINRWIETHREYTDKQILNSECTVWPRKWSLILQTKYKTM